MRLAAAVDIGGTKVRAALVDEKGEIHRRVERSTQPDAGTSSIVYVLEDLLDEAAGSLDEPRPAPKPGGAEAIGIGLAGWVEYPSGVVVFAPNLIYEEPEVGKVVRERFGLPVAVENDVNAAVWGEHEFGAGKGIDELLMLTIGTGIGGGIVIDGKLYRGARGIAGEFGHMTIVEGGPVCACGQRGCLEAMASGTAIARMAREGLGAAPDSILMELAQERPQRITGELVSEAANAGDAFAAGILERAGRSLGVGLANLTNAFDPQLILIGGGGAESGDFVIEPARLELARKLEGRREPPDLRLGVLGNDAGVIGAGLLALAGAR
jgi:glucokinase